MKKGFVEVFKALNFQDVRFASHQRSKFSYEKQHQYRKNWENPEIE
jgi:hypothetical protein